MGKVEQRISNGRSGFEYAYRYMRHHTCRERKNRISDRRQRKKKAREFSVVQRQTDKIRVERTNSCVKSVMIGPHSGVDQPQDLCVELFRSISLVNKQQQQHTHTQKKRVSLRLYWI